MSTIIQSNQLRSLEDRRATSSLHGFMPAVFHMFIRRMLSPWTLVFTLGIPVFMYLIFGVGQEYSLIEMPRGNVAAMVLVSMSQYAAVMITSMITAGIAIERVQGWTRTMALTPLGIRNYVAVKVVMSLVMTVVSIVFIYAIGFFTDAKMDAVVWVQTFILIVVLSVIPAMLGLLVGVVIRGEEAYGVLGGGTALLAFLSGMFVPLEQLSEFFQKVAEFTPLWGINRLALTAFFGWEELQWKFLFNVFGWLVIFAVGTWFFSRRSTGR